ncbi:ATP-binding cassette sub-family A member 17-like [Culicoides brevitarsis]|uniref:ATP-binding cassette sub-family A member 17-like n=1 Tax=Culicoides brevitarsis TaxID=469753 RepID=UPI00307B836E
MISNVKKLKLLLWKNFKIQKRHPYKLLLDILIPIVQCLILLFLRANIHGDKKLNFPSFNLTFDRLNHDAVFEKAIFNEKPENIGFEIDEITNNSISYRIKALEVIDDSTLMDILRTQRFINEAFIDHNLHNLKIYDRSKDRFLEFLQEYLQIVVLISFIKPVATITGTISLEKENHLKSYMKIMGIPSYLHYIAYFFTYFGQIIIISVIVAAVTKIDFGLENKVLPHSDFGVICIFLTSFGVSAIAYSFMMSSLSMNNASISSVIAVIFWFINYLPFTINRHQFTSKPLSHQMGLCLFSNTAMALGFSKIVELEMFKRGSTWENLFDVSGDRELGIGHVCIMLFIDAILYSTIAILVEKGSEMKFKKFWIKSSNDVNFKSQEDVNEDLFEVPSTTKKVTVQVQNLRKSYSGERFAVKGLTFNMFEDEIVILLGHNAAGKSTTISMLTGLLQPSSGKVLIFGKDVVETRTSNIGLCPQHNILFEDLNVKEHIIFYSCLKGLKSADIQRNIDHLVKDLQLEDQLNVQVKNLSGGIKRILSVSLAFCGDPKFVVLDEPSSGLDPMSMRTMWQMLNLRKDGRTILISTHSMEEADIIGDRIAVMSEGSLMCYATSDFLKQRISEGYKLTIKSNSTIEHESLLHLAKKQVSNLNMNITDNGLIELQLKDSTVKEIALLLKELEEVRSVLDITSLTISSPTMEDVFMKLGREVPEKHQEVENFNESKATFATSEHFKMNSEIHRTLNQIKAMIYKHLCYLRRNYKLILSFYGVTILFMLITYMRNIQSNEALKGKTLEDVVDLCRSIVQTTFGSNQVEDHSERLCRKYLTYPPEDQLKPQIILHQMNQIYEDQLQKSNSNLKIQTVFEPLLFKDIGFSFLGILELLRLRDLKYNIIIQSNNAFFGALGMLFAAAGIFLFYIKDRLSLFRLIQRIAGVNTGIYWFVGFVIDYLVFLTVIFVNFTMMLLLEIESYASWDEIEPLIVVTLLFCVTSLPCTYLLSTHFDHAMFGFIFTIVSYMFFGVIVGVVFLTLTFADEPMFNLQIFFMFIPPYAFTNAIVSVGQQNANRLMCKEACEKHETCFKEHQGWMCEQAPRICCDNFEFKYGFEYPGVGWNIVALIFMAIFSMILLLIIDFEVFKQWISRFRDLKERNYENLLENGDPNVNEEVKKEKNRIRGMTKDEIQNYQLVTKDLSKCFGKEIVVNQLCLAIERYECFGIFGRSSAGKTTTVNMISGVLLKSSGNVWIDGYSLSHHLFQVQKMIGYCPQFNGLFEDLTGYETMKIIAMLRGYPKKRLNFIIKSLADDFFFAKHLHKPIKNYSGGTKRKLSVALTLIGNTAIVILDEPTTGIDPAARKQLWNVINQARESQKTILLTSQMMEECETLCTNLSVLHKGNLKCMGTKEYLKEKYLNGFILELKLKSMPEGSSNVKAKEYFFKLFEDAELKEEYLKSLIYFIPSENHKLHEIFEAVAMSKEFLLIEDFAVKDATLEQIFMFF